MDSNKLNSILQIALLYDSLISPITFRFITGQEKGSRNWYVLLQYYGDLEELREKYHFIIYRIDNRFAYIYIDKNQIGTLSNEANVIFIELPSVANYILDESTNAICVTPRVYSLPGFNVTGEGILVGIIDSGIDYFHDDFRNADGTTRIYSMWDQSDVLAENDGNGTEYTREQINEALRQPTKLQGLEIVPSIDTLGHGTAVAGIAAGNGRASNGRYVGIAPESELIIVKVESQIVQEPDIIIGPNTAQIMLGIEYILRQAISLNRPVSIQIGFGLNEGTHDGKSSLETYIDQASFRWKNNMVVGVGNQANKDSHTSGNLRQDEAETIDIFIDQDQPYYLFTTVYGTADTVSIEIKSPSGESTGRFDGRLTNYAALLGNNSIMINFTNPGISSTLHQINVLIDKFEGSQVATGVWQVILYGDEIVEENYNIWGSSIDPLRRLTRFLNPDPYTTLTIPSTSQVITSVGAFNGRTSQIAAFSGRGYPLNEQVKPDIMAPGVGIVAPTSLSDNGYATVSGTSAAAAFVSGAYALLLQYGLDNSPSSFLYGEALKSFMMKAALRPIRNQPYPNRSWGYGIVCVERILDALKEQYDA